MKKLVVASNLIVAFFAFSSFANLIDIGTNITVYDNWSNSTAWHGTGEDQEVEPPDMSGQEWDLEGFFLDGSSLSMVGGYNFATGQYSPGWDMTYTSGDIFIDVNGDAKYGISQIGQTNTEGYNSVANTGGWDYAISFDASKRIYDVFQIDAADIVSTPYFGGNRPATPFEYVSGGTKISSNSFTYLTGLQDADVGFQGGYHNAIEGIDLSFLGGNTNFTAHFTMGCGNDMLIGKGTVQVPEPGTFSLIGIGLLSLAGLLRLRKKK